MKYVRGPGILAGSLLLEGLFIGRVIEKASLKADLVPAHKVNYVQERRKFDRPCYFVIHSQIVDATNLLCIPVCSSGARCCAPATVLLRMVLFLERREKL